MKYDKIIIALFFFVFGFALFSAAQQQGPLPQDTLARIGTTPITARDLIRRVELMPWPEKIRPSRMDSKKAQALYAMLAEKLLAAEARRMGVPDDTAMGRMRHGLENLLIRAELYKREVAGKAIPAEKEIRTALKRYTSELQVILYVLNSEEDAQVLLKRLRNIKKPDSLRAAVPAFLYRAMDTVVVNVGLSDTTVERVAYEIGSTRVSKPFSSSKFGWAVMYLLDRHPNPAAAKQNSADRYRSVEKILRSRMEKDLAEKYYYKILEPKFAQADSTVFNLLADSIVGLWKEDTVKYHAKNGYFVTAEMTDVLLDRLHPFLDKSFVDLDGGKLTLGEILEMLRYEYFVSPDLEGNRLKAQLNEEIKRLVGCEILSREGRKEYLQNSEAVQRDLRPWTDYWAARALFYQMRERISVADDDVMQHFMKYKEIFGSHYEVNVREILCASLPDISQAIDELQRGSSFSQVARQFSIRREWATNGGESGYFLVRQHPDIGFHALCADTGTLVGPLHLTEGYSVFKLIGKRRMKEAGADFDTLRQNIKAWLLTEQRKQVMDRFIADLARRQQVSINYSALKNVKITTIPMFTRRHIGFGGTMSAEPILMQQWDWIKEFQQPINIVP
ncbi:MAG: hypothetical protein EHM64_11835 [Ignavibacteriae bacterium]|nr:MAG: hypothetical protein EHM64_11835 [Ignavibacteriota bacterium]